MPLIIAAAALLLFSGLFLFLYFYNDTLRFHHMTEEFFAEAFRQDSLSLHYTLAEPSDYLQKPSPVLQTVTPGSGSRTGEPASYPAGNQSGKAEPAGSLYLVPARPLSGK